MNFALISCLLVLQSLCLSPRFVVSLALAPVYWNTSNSIFKSSRNSHLIEVNLNDEIDFVCPHYEQQQQQQQQQKQQQEKDLHVEFYVVYQVKEKNYRNCHVDEDDSSIMILNCNNPFQKKRFTLLFESFQAIPNVPEFVSGGKYYFITTSTGRRDGLMNTHLGACHSNHMKLIVSVCCQPTTPPQRFHYPVLTAGLQKHTKPHPHKSSTSNKSHSIPWKKRNKNPITPLVPKHDLLSSLSGASHQIGPTTHCLLTITYFVYSLLFNR